MWKRVVAPTVLVSLLWTAVSSVTTFYINWLCESHTRVLSENVATIQSAGALQDVLWRLQVAVMQPAILTDSTPYDEIAELEKAFEKHLGRAEKTGVTPEERVLVQTIRNQFSLYRDHIRRRLQRETAAMDDQPLPAGETMRLAKSVAQPCAQLLEHNERLLAESTSQTDRLTSSVQVVRIVAILMGPAIGILFGVLVALRLHRSISEISVTLRDATGNLDHSVGQIHLGRGAELPELQRQVQEVAVRIKQVMEHLEQARKEAMRAGRLAAVGEIAAGIAHELRNPLTSIKLLVQSTARREPKNLLGGRQLEIVVAEISRMENTIQSLLDFARPPVLHRVRHDLRETLGRAKNLVVGRARQQGVIVTVKVPPQSAMVDGDPEQLLQVFVNLLLNGIDAMPQGGQLEIVLEMAQPQTGSCRVAFRDSGCGIPHAMLERLFEPFASSKESGTGLGLAVSRRIVQDHQGTIAAQNLPQQGAEFTVILPLDSSMRESESPQDIAQPRLSQVGPLALPGAPAELTHAHTAGHRR